MRQRAPEARRSAPGIRPGARETSPPLVQLGRAIGNRAVAGLLQRQADGDDTEFLDEPLSSAEEASAISYYRKQAASYTADIMREIQSAVGAPETGEADGETVQAVARWQRDQGANSPPLKVDGKAGPRTLPRLFRHGLNATGEGKAFGGEAQTGVIDQWATLTPQQRAAELVRLVNAHLIKAGVPAVAPDAKDTGGSAGSFDLQTWTMEIGLPALSAGTLTRDAAADIVDTIYHEARHAEQWFRMAQLLASRKRSAAQIAKEMQIPPHIAEAASKDPLAAGSMQALIAKGWYDSVYGAGSDHRDRTLDALAPSRKALAKAQERYDKNPTAANLAALERAQERRRRAFDAYQNLPEENDAWATGPMTSEGVTRGTPEPEPDEELETELEKLVGAGSG